MKSRAEQFINSKAGELNGSPPNKSTVIQWLTEFAKDEVVKSRKKCDDNCICTPDETTGTTTVRCCNICGKPTEDFWRRGIIKNKKD